MNNGRSDEREGGTCTKLTVRSWEAFGRSEASSMGRRRNGGLGSVAVADTRCFLLSREGDGSKAAASLFLLLAISKL